MGYLPQGMAEATRLWTQVARISLESQMVIGMRMAGMIGLLPQHKGESRRMLKEKLDAAQESGSAVIKALSNGARADKVVEAALHPYGKRTHANARRLTRSVTRRKAK
ncbi:MAG: antibiotic ABC transporter [Paracoccus sp. (in: a-proteobacteria)]|nr:antibiotic ABC transporter [Paracoccus sp. (in: a-proteobacteria)]